MKIFIVLFLLSASITVFSQEYPHVNKVNTGKYDLVFSENQNKAINDFLSENNMLTLLLDDDYDPNIYAEIEDYMNSGIMQHRYATWGDFNKDSFQDFLLLFVFPDKSQNTFHPKGYVYTLVIFEGKSKDLYNTVIVHKQVEGIIDGVTYDKTNNIIFFSSFGVADGLVEWTGKKYKVTEMKGD